MPQVAEALSTWRWLVRQIPRALAIAAALGALANAVLGLLGQRSWIVIVSVAWELTALLALWLETRWRSNQDLESRLDQIAGNALQAGGQVFEGLRVQRDELSSELRSVREANQELEHAIEGLGQERSGMETAMRLAQDDLARAEETERVRAALMERHRQVAEDLRGLLQLSQNQIAQETFWVQLRDGLNGVADRYDQMVRSAVQGEATLSHITDLLESVRQLRARMEQRHQDGDGAETLTRSLEEAASLIHDMGERLRHSETAAINLARALDEERSKLGELELQMQVCRQRVAVLVQQVEALATRSADPSSRNGNRASASHSR